MEINICADAVCVPLESNARISAEPALKSNCNIERPAVKIGSSI